MTTLVATMSCQGVIFHHSRPDVAIKARLEESENFLIKVTIFELIFAVVCSSSERDRSGAIQRVGEGFYGFINAFLAVADPAQGDNSSSISGFYSLTNEDPPPI